MSKALLASFAIAVLASVAFLSSKEPANAAEPLPAEAPDGLATAVFAGGCFWCVESDFEKLDGVKEAISGYTGGLLESPTYQRHDGHVEAVEVIYDP
ncbi:MAG: peptide-methionine (S)-S-oxide reductase, partial [Parvularculaceae bacterium]